MITPYGRSTVIEVLVAASVLTVCVAMVIRSNIAQGIVIGVVWIVVFLVVNFFRDPQRVTPDEEHVVVSPADGRVVLIQDVDEPEYVRQDAVQVSIFMSPLDVHVNRWPISGTVECFKHVDGMFTPAYHDKSSECNERTMIGVQEDGYRLLFKQVAGSIARRIIAEVAVGQHAVRGDRFGMIKFGSRVDVIMPRHTTVNIRLHDRVVAGETILATYARAKSRV